MPFEHPGAHQKCWNLTNEIENSKHSITHIRNIESGTTCGDSEGSLRSLYCLLKPQAERGGFDSRRRIKVIGKKKTLFGMYVYIYYIKYSAYFLMKMHGSHLLKKNDNSDIEGGAWLYNYSYTPDTLYYLFSRSGRASPHTVPLRSADPDWVLICFLSLTVYIVKNKTVFNIFLVKT